MNISIVKDYICFCVIPIEENELHFLRCDGFFESIGLIGGCRSLLCAYIKYCYPNNSLSLIKQLWSYLQYNHFVFFHLTDMTEVFKGRTFENIMLYSGKNKEKKGETLQRCMQLNNHSNSYGQYLLGIHK